MVQFFEPNISRNDAYRLKDVKFHVLPEDFVQKVKDPQFDCSRKKPCKPCVLDISKTLFILPSFFHEQF